MSNSNRNQQQTVTINGSTYALVEEIEQQPVAPQVQTEVQPVVQNQQVEVTPAQAEVNFEDDPRVQRLLGLTGYDDFGTFMASLEDITAAQVAQETGLSLEDVKAREAQERALHETTSRLEQEQLALTQLTQDRFMTERGIDKAQFESMGNYLNEKGIDITNINSHEQLELYYNGYIQTAGQDQAVDGMQQNRELAARYAEQSQTGNVPIGSMSTAGTGTGTATQPPAFDAVYEAKVADIIADLDKPFTHGNR